MKMLGQNKFLASGLPCANPPLPLPRSPSCPSPGCRRWCWSSSSATRTAASARSSAPCWNAPRAPSPGRGHPSASPCGSAEAWPLRRVALLGGDTCAVGDRTRDLAETVGLAGDLYVHPATVKAAGLHRAGVSQVHLRSSIPLLYSMEGAEIWKFNFRRVRGIFINSSAALPDKSPAGLCCRMRLKLGRLTASASRCGLHLRHHLFSMGSTCRFGTS